MSAAPQARLVNPRWPGRDRFVLSTGRGSMPPRAPPCLTDYDLPMDEPHKFRQPHGKSTGWLGQGIANAVGMGPAEKLRAAEFKRQDRSGSHDIVDHRACVILGGGRPKGLAPRPIRAKVFR